MKATMLLLGLLVVQMSVLHAERFESIPLADGSPSGFRLILPGTPAALAAQQEQFVLPSQQNNGFDTPRFALTAFEVELSKLQSHLAKSQPPQFETFFMPVHHQPKELHSVFVNPTVSTPVAPVRTSFQPSHTPASNLVTQQASIIPETNFVNISPISTTFTQSHTPASNQITHSILQTPSNLETVPVQTTKFTPQTIESFIHSRNSQIKLSSVKSSTTTPSTIVLHNFDNSQNFPVKTEVRKPVSRGPAAKFVNENRVSGETFLDVRGFRGEDVIPEVTTFAPVTFAPIVTSTSAPFVTSTSAPVTTETTSKPKQVRVTVTKRVRGPARTVVSRVTKVQPRKQVSSPVVNSLKETVVPVRPLIIKEVPVTRGPSRFSSTTESHRFESTPLTEVKTEETKDEEFTRQAQEASYSFSSAVDDAISDSAVMRQETRKDGAVEGSYSYSDGFFKRTVHYKADHLGYRVLKEEVEPLGDGPNPDPEGRANVALQTSTGVQSKYSVTSSDIRSTEEE